jgi:hypothetical protein
VCSLLIHRRVAPFVTEITAAVVRVDWSARRAHVSLLSPSASSNRVRAVPDATAFFHVGNRSTSQFDASLRWRCSLGAVAGLQLNVPAVCGVGALASLLLCFCAAVFAFIWIAAAAVRFVSLKHGGREWKRKPYKDRRENL